MGHPDRSGDGCGVGHVLYDMGCSGDGYGVGCGACVI